MREIKFRAIHKLTKKKWDEEELIFHNGKWYEDWRAFEDNMSLNMNQCELMQYTGLKDKNGVDIYEGDVVHWMKEFISPADMRTKRKIDSNEEIHQKESGEWGMGEVGNTLSEELLNVEVIGNIYENPELSEREGK